MKSAHAYGAITLLESTTITTAQEYTWGPFTNLGKYRQLMLLFKTTDVDAAVADTFDLYFDVSPDGGTTWVNVAHFPQLLGNGADANSHWCVLDPGGAPGTATIAVSSDCAAGVVRPAMFTNYARLRGVLVDGGAHGQSVTLEVYAFGK